MRSTKLALVAGSAALATALAAPLTAAPSGAAPSAPQPSAEGSSDAPHDSDHLTLP